MRGKPSGEKKDGTLHILFFTFVYLIRNWVGTEVNIHLNLFNCKSCSAREVPDRDSSRDEIWLPLAIEAALWWNTSYFLTICLSDILVRRLGLYCGWIGLYWVCLGLHYHCLGLYWDYISLYCDCLGLYWDYTSLYLDCLGQHYHCLGLYWDCLGQYCDCLGLYWDYIS